MSTSNVRMQRHPLQPGNPRSKIQGKSIAEVLNMTVEEAASIRNVPAIKSKLDTLTKVGLGYIKLGQSSTTLQAGSPED